MSLNHVDLYNLIISGGDEKLKTLLKEYENDHNFEAVFQSLLVISKKSLLEADLRPCMMPFIKRYLATLPVAKTTVMANELVQFCNPEYSLKLSVQLIRLLSETAQLGNSTKFRQFMKTKIVDLQNFLFDKKCSIEADLLLVAVSNVLLFELNFLDNVDEDDVMAVWEKLKKRNSTIYHFASYLINTFLNNSADEHELAICDADAFDADFVDYCQFYIHVPLSRFKQENVLSFIAKMIKYYLENRRLDELYELVFNVPELRNNLSSNISLVLITSTLKVLWQRIAKDKKGKSGETGQLKHKITQLLFLLTDFRDDDATEDNFRELFVACCKLFTRFTHQKDMKATFFVDCLVSMQEMIPFFDKKTKLLLIAVLPFVIGVGGSEEKFVQIFKVYSILLEKLPEEYLKEISSQYEVIGDFLDVAIRKFSKDSNELRYHLAKFVHYFLYLDQEFMLRFISNSKKKEFDSLMTTFNKVVRPATRLLKNEVGTVFQICFFYHERTVEKEFKIQSTIKFITESLREWLLSSTEQLAKNPVLMGLIADLTTIFIGFVRLFKNPETKSDDSKAVLPVLMALFTSEAALNLILNSEKTFVINSLLKQLVVCARFLDDYGEFFFDLGVLINIATFDFVKDEILKELIKFVVGKNKEWNWKGKMMELFPVETLTTEVKNGIFRFLRIIIELELMEGKTDSDFDYYMFLLLVKMQKGSNEAMEFTAVYLPTIEKKEKFENFLATSVMACANALALQVLTKEYENSVIEIKRSIAAVQFIDALTCLSPRVMINQLHIIGQLISKLIFNLTTFRQVVYECRENPKRRQEIKTIYDYYLKQLAAVCRKIAKSKELSIQLPFMIANCLTGEREQNLPTFHLLSGCDIHALSFLSTNLPNERKRRFAITFPNFMVQNRFTG